MNTSVGVADSFGAKETNKIPTGSMLRMKPKNWDGTRHAETQGLIEAMPNILTGLDIPVAVLQWGPLGAPVTGGMVAASFSR